MLVYMHCKTCLIWAFAGSPQIFYLAQVVLLRPSVPSPGAASPHEDNGVGFSVSAIATLGIPRILKRYARPQSSHHARCVCFGDLLLGSTYSSRQFPREIYANGLDVGSHAVVSLNTIPLTVISLTEATFLSSRALSHIQLA